MSVLSIQKHTLTLTDASTTADLTFTVETPPNVTMTGTSIPTLIAGERFGVGSHDSHDGLYEVVTVNGVDDYLVESLNGNTITAASESAQIYEVVPVLADLTGSPVLANCIPFAMARITATNGAPDTVASYAATVDFATGSPDKVRAQTGAILLGNREVVVETTVVEFDPADVNVYSGTVDFVSGDSFSKVINAAGDGAPFSADVDLSKAFLYFTYTSANKNNWWRTCMIVGEITDVNELTFTQEGNLDFGTLNWYVAEAKTTAWTVEPVSITLAAAVSSAVQGETISVTPAKSFILGSYRGSDAGDADANDENTIDVTLTNGTTVTAQRSIGTAVGEILWTGFVVEFAAGGNENVYRDTLAWATSEAAKTDVTITGGPVSDAADCMAHVAGSVGTVGTGSFPGTDSTDVPDAFTAWTFTSGSETTLLTVTHSTNGGEANQDISWEVIEWDVGGAAPARRVMVIS